MKVCVYGAGAVGGHFAARLARGGADVSVVARGPQLAAIQANGLRVIAPDAEFQAKVTATDDPAALGPQDAVLVTLKAPSLPSLAAGIGPLLGPDTAVAFAMNGIPWWYFHADAGRFEGRRLPRIDPGDAVWNAVGPQRAIGGVVSSACTVVEPGVIRVANTGSRLLLGEPNGQITPRVTALADALTAGGMIGEAVDDIRARVWSKLIVNIGAGTFGVLTQASGKVFYASDTCCDALRHMTAELCAVAKAMGVTATADPEAQIAMSRKSTHTSSIVQDLQLGRPMEIDSMFATAVEFARLVDVPTPTLDLLVALVQARATAAGLYQG